METVSHATASRASAYEALPLIKETLQRTRSYAATSRMTGFSEITIRQLMAPPPPRPSTFVYTPPQVPSTALTIKEVIMLCCAEEGLSYQDIVGPNQSRRLAHPRQRFMWVVRKAKPNASLPEIGRRFGGRDHTTVMHGLRKVDSRLLAGPEEGEKVKALLDALQSVEAPRDTAARIDAMILRMEGRIASLRARRAALSISVMRAA